MSRLTTYVQRSILSGRRVHKEMGAEERGRRPRW